MKDKHTIKKIMSLTFAFILAAGYVFPSAQYEVFALEGKTSAVAAAYKADWADSISEMLAAGKYEEGVVVAGIDMSKAKRSEDPGSALDSNKLRPGAEEVMNLDAESGSGEEFSSWLRELKDSMTGQDDGISIISIRRSGMTTEQILKILASDDSVIFAEPNYIIDLGEDGDSDISVDDPEDADQADNDAATPGEVPEAKAAGEDDADVAPEMLTPNSGGGSGDGTQFQWSSSENTTYHAAGKKGDVSMKVPGWPDGSNMDHEIIVAVMDMPVDFSNPDLEERAYTFTPAQQAALGCDVHGYNAMWTSKDGKLDYPVQNHHGTHVAGIIGASWNGEGVSGVGSDVRLISVQNGDTGCTSLIDSLRGYTFLKKAVESGVDIRVINNSWTLEQSSKAMDAAVTELGKLGVVSIFAAGNSATDLSTVPDIKSFMGDNPYMIQVASTTPAGELADSSCYSRELVTLGAPGANILSTSPASIAPYLPALLEDNKFYENFEDPENVSLKVSQIEFDLGENEWGGRDYIPNPEKIVNEAEIVSGSGDMGFEGDNVLKLNIDRSKTSGYSGDHLALRIDLNLAGAGVSKGDVLGLMYGSDKELEPIYSKAVGGERQSVLYEKNNRNCWAAFNCNVDGTLDDGKLTLIMVIVTNGATEMHLDTFGIADEGQKTPYEFLSGTSMAAPAVTGAAAVIASRHYDELNKLKDQDPSEAAKELATLVRSSVRPLESLKDMTSTGGIIDLTVDTKVSDPDADRPGPDITDIAVSGNKVTLTGKGFGDNRGTVEVRKYVAGKHSIIDSSIASWSDSEAVLTLDKDFEGIIEVILTAADGAKKDTIVRFVNKSSNIFVREHSFLSGTGDPVAFDEGDADSLGDYETSGVLVGGDDKLYYLPEITKIEENPAHRAMYIYDPKKDSWTEGPVFPAWVIDVSVAWLDGKLYVKGTAVDVDESGTIPQYEREDYAYEPGEVLIYSYTPGAGSWTKCSSDAAASEYTLITDGSKLMLAGTSEQEYEDAERFFPAVRDYDPAKGAGGNEIYISASVTNPKVVCAGEKIYMFDFFYGCWLYEFDKNTGSTEVSEIELPEVYFGEHPERRESELNRINPKDVVLLSDGDTLIMTGPPAKDGSSDTYTLKVGEKSFEPVSKRASDAEVILPCAAVLDGRLYVLGASYIEPGKRVFRSTLLPGYTAKKCTITYDLNGGSYDGSKDDITEVYEEDTVISIHEAPEREGYTFTYWKGSEYRPGDSYTVTEDHTFVAQWEKDGGSGEASNDDPDSSGEVRTGDELHVGVWMAIAFMAALMLTVMLIIRRKMARK